LYKFVSKEIKILFILPTLDAKYDPTLISFIKKFDLEQKSEINFNQENSGFFFSASIK